MSKSTARSKNQRESTLRELREAIERIAQLTPRSPKLLATLKRKKRLRLSVAAVASEAGMTRTTIYDRYPEVLADIAARRKRRPVVRMTTAEEVETNLREENAKLSQAVKDALSENAMLLFRLSAAQDKIKRLERKR